MRTYIFHAWQGTLPANILEIVELENVETQETKKVVLTDKNFLDFILNTPGNFCTLKGKNTTDNVIRIGYTPYSNFMQR